MYVADEEHDTLYVIDEKTKRTTENLAVGDRPTKIAINPSTNNVYVANSDTDTVSVIDGYKNKVTNVKVGEHPSDIDINSNTNLVYVTTSLDGTVSIIDDLAAMNSKKWSINYAQDRKEFARYS